MRVELHCHSNCSDGSFPPGEVGRRARDRGVELFCLTDHDSWKGTAEAAEAFGGEPHLRGVELSCHHDGRTVHLLLYGAAGAGSWAALDEEVERIVAARRTRAGAIVERLRAAGAEIDLDEVFAAAGDRPVGRPHLADALLRAGVVRSLDEAYRRYLRDGGVADVPLELTSVERGLEIAADIGARSSLAHPHTVPGAVEMLAAWRKLGLGGIEVFYSGYTRNERRRWAKVAEEHNLVATGGSDFHGAALPQVTKLGIDIPSPWAERLRVWFGLEP